MQDAWTDQGMPLEAESEDNGLAEPADTDVAPEEEAPVELTFDEKLFLLEEAVTKHPLNREVLYKTLAYCAEERTLQDLEAKIASWPEFKTATQNQARMADTLVRAHGLERIERDADGEPITPEQKEGLDEDAIDDLVQSVSFRATDVGARFVEQHRPRARLVELLQLAPERAGTYIELLEFTAEKPRSYGEISELLRGRPVLETVIDGTRHTMQPSVFVDKLERAGALVWKEGWSLTEEGEAFLQDLRASDQG
ncbi:hypothetical protein [Arabiibacter massiliensis]|uniref:hypothetical protein n=1 Tax=Arabiibacter massiliensis TaxID=1870985 RepID=UPI001E4C6393|nr:hypothetical protein [Arabiibacter massiliensis]